MPIAKITGHGLIAIAFSVAGLWACVIGDRAMVRQAQIDRLRVMRDFQHFQNRLRTEPAAAPTFRAPARPVVSAG